MEGFKGKMKKAAIYGAMFLGMAKGNELLNQYNEKQLSGRQKSVNELPSIKEVHSSHESSTVHLVELSDGTLINPEEQTATEPQKAWLLNHMSSKEYREKARAEGLTDKEIDDRIKRVKITPIIRYDVKDLPNGSDGQTINYMINFNEYSKIDVAAADKENIESVIVHEGQHAATRGNQYLSRKAKKLYEESFDNTRLDKIDAGYATYLKEYTERDARKKELEYEAEQMGIIKAGQKITDEDYQKIMELYNKGKFTYGARQFIETTKPEYFLRIMNEIAENQSDDKAPDNLPIENQA